MKKIFTIIIVLFAANSIFAQQEAMVTQYMFNQLYINPGYAGTHQTWGGTLQHRRQWTNFDGAPKTSVLSVDGPIKNKNMGLGFLVTDDKIGVTHQTDFSGIYSYQIETGNGKLSFGLKAGLSNYACNVNDLKVWDASENVFMADDNRQLSSKFGFGTYYYMEKFYAGISVPTLYAHDPGKKWSTDMEKSTLFRKHYYLTSGGIISLNDNISLRPSFLFKYLPNTPMQGDLNVSALFKETFWVGLSYRTNDAVAAIVEYQLSKGFRLGYSFDYSTSVLRNYSSGTHEIMLGYTMGRKDGSKDKMPRYF